MTTSDIAALNLSIITTLVCWGFWGIVDKKALSGSTAGAVFVIMLLLQILEIPIAMMLLEWTTPGWSIAPGLPFWSALGSLAYGVSLLAYLAAMVRAEASFVLGFTAAYPIVTQLLAVAFLNETLVPQRLLGGALVGLGVFAIGLSRSSPGARSADPVLKDSTTEPESGREPCQTEQQPQRQSRFQSLVVALCVCLATFNWGVKGLIDKKALSLGTPLEVFLVEAIFNTLLLVPIFFYCKFRGSWPRFNSRPTWLYSSLSALLVAIGGWTYLVALSISSASYVITITGCYPLLMYLLALLWLKEQFNKVRFAGIVLVVLGGVIVQMTQNS